MDVSRIALEFRVNKGFYCSSVSKQTSIAKGAEKLWKKEFIVYIFLSSSKFCGFFEPLLVPLPFSSVKTRNYWHTVPPGPVCSETEMGFT